MQDAAPVLVFAVACLLGWYCEYQVNPSLRAFVLSVLAYMGIGAAAAMFEASHRQGRWFSVSRFRFRDNW